MEGRILVNVLAHIQSSAMSYLTGTSKGNWMDFVSCSVAACSFFSQIVPSSFMQEPVNQLNSILRESLQIILMLDLNLTSLVLFRNSTIKYFMKSLIIAAAFYMVAHTENHTL